MNEVISHSERPIPAAVNGSVSQPTEVIACDQIFNLEALLDNLAGDEDFLGEIIDIFLQGYEPVLQEIRVGVIAADSKKIAEKTHKLKGSLAELYAPRAYEAARRLEEIGARGESEQAAELFEQLEIEIDRLKRTLEQMNLAAIS
ncbi:MAG: Hpt domain-containing protein [Acidobacteriota bacterium]